MSAKARSKAETTPRRTRARKWLRRLLGLAVVLLVLLLVGSLWLRHLVVRSLPQLEGRVALAGLEAPVSIERDSLGVPTVRATVRADAAQALGFLHAQERYFQMDLSRRSAAGELSALFGPVARDRDRTVRQYLLRRTAREHQARLPERQRLLSEAYTRGVNQGLERLGGPPFEYLLLRQDPVAWQPEDSVLVALAMFLQLQDTGRRESTLELMRETLPPELFHFLTPTGTAWDAPLMGGLLEPPPLPGPEVLDLRGPRPAEPDPVPESSEAPVAGSNSWAVAGEHTADGRALLANDMHLPLRVPNVWYRARLVWTEAGEEQSICGVTLPGAQVVVVGSNTRVAWGFTNSQVDTSDLVPLTPDPEREDHYLTPDGSRPFEKHRETIEIQGAPTETLEVRTTVWGPVVERDRHGRERALRWAAHVPGGLDLDLMDLERARDVDEALELANRSGIPAQNFVAADSGGRIGWTLAGCLPREVGASDTYPGRWEGCLEPSDYPRLVDPPSGRVWTANARVVDASWLAVVGDGGYSLGARASQIRDALLPLEEATAEDLLAIQLDDRALLLERWQGLLLDTLTPEALAEHPERQTLRRLAENWTGHASVADAGFRMVRTFRRRVMAAALEPLVAPCRQLEPEFETGWLRQSEGPVWRLLQEQPAHLLDPRYGSWHALALSAADSVIETFNQGDARLEAQTWGRRNTVRIRHPLSMAVPQLSRWLDMPTQPLPGASHMPRAQGPSHGASQRLVVSPGNEAAGFFHMPGGQSGHPLSAHYRDGHAAWVRGEPTPFLPGPTLHTLELTPAG